MPLVHRFSGPGFAPSESKSQKLRAAVAPPLDAAGGGEPASGPANSDSCHLCSARVPIFDLARRCCVDRYESHFGSVHEHRSMIARARQAAQLGDLGPAQRLVESYRRVFGSLAAVELRRSLWRSIGDVRPRPFDHGFESAAVTID